MNYIVSDIEGTLTTGSSWKAMRRYYKDSHNSLMYNRFFLRWIPRHLLVVMGISSRKNAMIDWMKDEISLFRGMALVDFEQMASWIVNVEMWPKRRTEILLDIKRNMEEKTQVIVVSSGYQPIVKAFSEKLGAIPIGTPLMVDDGKIMGIENQINAYENKVKRILEHIGSADILLAYGDTASDIPMLECSQHPVAVYPDAELRKFAERKGWRLITPETK